MEVRRNSRAWDPLEGSRIQGSPLFLLRLLLSPHPSEPSPESHSFHRVPLPGPGTLTSILPPSRGGARAARGLINSPAEDFEDEKQSSSGSLLSESFTHGIMKFQVPNGE